MLLKSLDRDMMDTAVTVCVCVCVCVEVWWCVIEVSGQRHVGHCCNCVCVCERETARKSERNNKEKVGVNNLLKE